MISALTVLCFLTILSVKQCIYRDWAPHTWRFKGWKILTLVDDLCCVDFVNSIGVVAAVRRNWAQLSMLHLKMMTESSPRNIVF
jgi:hypothetical protein